MRGLERVVTALLLGPNAVLALDALASSVMFTTVRINTGICTSSAAASSSSISGNGTTNGNGSGAGSDGAVSTDYGTYSFLGFYPTPDQGTILKRAEGKSTTSSQMTVEFCGNFCGGTEYFAIQNGTECSCDETGPSGTPVQNVPSEIPCPGNTAEICGAPGYAVVFRKDTGGGGPETTVVTGVTSDSLGLHTFTSTEVVSSASSSSGGPVTVVVTGVTTDTAGVHTFTSTEIVSSTVTATSVTGVATSVVTASSGAPTSSSGSVGSSSSTGVSSSSSGGASSSATSSSSATGSSASSSASITSSGASSTGSSSSTASGGSSSTSNTASSTTASGSTSTTATGVTNTTTTGSTSTTATGSTSTTATGSTSTTATGSTSTTAAGSTSTTATGSTSTTATGSTSTTATGSTSTTATGSKSTTATGTSTTSSTATPETTDSTVPVCAANNNTAYTDLFAYTYEIKCNVDLHGQNLYDVHSATFDDCLLYCDLLDTCIAATWNQATDGDQTTPNCFTYYAFDYYIPTTYTSLYSGVSKNSTNPGYADANQDLCGTGANQTVIYNEFGDGYFIGCEQNAGGQDLPAYTVDTLDACLTYCSRYEGCNGVDFKYQPPIGSGNNCYPKSGTINNPSYSAGVQAAVKQP